MEELRRAARDLARALIRRDAQHFWLALFAVGLLGIYVKHISLSLSSTGGYLVASRVLGVARPSDLPFLARIGLFRFDILWGLVVIPALGSVGLVWLRPRLARFAAAAIAIGLSLMLFTSLLSLSSVGRLMTYAMLVDAIDFGVHHPEFIFQYVSPRSIFKLALVVTLLIALLWLPVISRRMGIGTRPLVRASLVACGFASVVVVVAEALAAFTGTPRTAMDRSIMWQAVTSLMQRPPHFAELDATSPRELAGFYRSFTHSPHYAPTPYFGTQRGSDLIVFVLETGPMASVEIDGGLATLPATGALAAQSFVPRQHMSTYPYTSDAVFSMLGGMYPVLIRNATASRPAGTRIDSSLPQALFRHGYRTYRYAYEDTFESDSSVFSSFGMRDHFRGDTDARRRDAEVQRRVDSILAEYAPIPSDQQPTLRRYLEIDLACLAALQEQVLTSKRTGERFATVFFPVVGHGPWPALRGEPDMRTRGRRLIELQDRWIGEIVEQLRRGGWLADTVVLVTADHGVRTKDEDPNFPVGTMTPYSYHVPLVLFAPRALTHTANIDSVTSHVDIAPTVLELLGIENDEVPLTQGSLMFAPDLAQRTVFLFAAGYHGTDGFIENRRYYMKRTVDDQHFENSSFDFPPSSFVAPGSHEADMIDDTLATMYSVQDRLRELAFTEPKPRAATGGR